MAKKQFKAESRRLLELMINSIYTNSEIFLRELISNASDALDKRYYLSMTGEIAKVNKKDLTIRIERDPVNRTLTITDTGIGMTAEELEKNLGTIARSGSLEFREQLEKAPKNIDIIGQFGVGFYSGFIVAKKITVESLSARESQANVWTSDGSDGYRIEPCDRSEVGTKIILQLKDDTPEQKYSRFLEEGTIRELVKKYSDYVRYPIMMDVEKSIPDPTDDTKRIMTTETETLNSMVPLWKKSRSKISKEEYNEFYKGKFNDWNDPLKVIHTTVEGNVSYTALLFIPSEAPYNFFQPDQEYGLQLYSKGVFIMDNAKDLLPEKYRFIRGLVDSDDLSLNISREILQQDHQVKALAASLEKKIKKALEDMLKDEREDYEKFYEAFNSTLKYDIYRSYGMSADDLKDLLLYRSNRDGKYTTLKEYRERMPEDQKEIYYASGESVSEIERMPVMAKLKEKNYEVLCFTDRIDEFVITMIPQYDGMPFRSVTKGDLDLDTEEEKKKKTETAEANKDMLTAMKEALGDKVKEVRLSSRLQDDAVCLVSEGGLSLEMEKVLSQDPLNRGMMKAVRILEVNPDHPLFTRLQAVFAEDKDKFNEYADILYDQACLIEGLPIDDPLAYTKKITELMIKA